jgi:mRNA interferase HigB
MEVRNAESLTKFGKKHRDAVNWLKGWLDVAEQASWSNLQELRSAFPSADGVKVRSGLVVTVFNVKGNEYRLLTFVDYAAQEVTVIDVLTHAEYSKNRPSWKDRL